MTNTNGKSHAEVKTISADGSRFSIKQLDPSGGRIILIKRTEKLTPEMLKAFADDISNRLGISAVVVAVNSLSDMREMNEADMRQHGWVREAEIQKVEKRLTLSLSYLQVVWEEASKLEPLVDMAECPYPEGIGRLNWLLKQIGEKYRSAEEVAKA